MKYALITGVSSGIGKAIAKKLLQEGFFVFGSVRRDGTTVELSSKYPQHFQELKFDTTDYAQIDEAYLIVKEKVGDKGLQILVNNAGVAKYGPMQEVPIAELRDQFEVNVFSTVKVTQTFLKLLGAEVGNSNRGKLFVISSAAGILTRPMLGPYSSSKHALEAIFDAYRRELMMFGIQVVIIEPGPIKTEIWNKAKGNANPYAHTPYKKIFDHLNDAVKQIEDIGLDVSKVSDAVWKAYNSKNPKARYLITPKKMQFKLAMHVLPAKWLDKIFYKELKKLNK